MPGVPGPDRHDLPGSELCEEDQPTTLLEAVFQTDDRRFSFQGYINVVPQQYKVVKTANIK